MKTLAEPMSKIREEQRRKALVEQRVALLERFRVNGWTAEVLDGIFSNPYVVLDDDASESVVYRLKMPGAAPVIVRGGLSELARKAKGLK